jgi:hypothetical protein
MEHFVTLFDRAFAPQGLALHRSLLRHSKDFTLWVLCIDREVEELLAKLELPKVRLLSLSDIESEQLLSVKGGRTAGEYCWTLTPFTFDAVFDADATAERVTYVDADVWLLQDPNPTFWRFERSGAAVQITEHAYAPDHDQTATSGRYCVQFLTMTRDGSEPVRRWWQERCIEWCFARVEDGKFGDQKYLDDWPERFGDLVHVAEPRGSFQGPWNATRYPYSEALLYHFHGLRFASAKTVTLAPKQYWIPETHRGHVYGPYLQDLADVMAEAGIQGTAEVACPSREKSRIGFKTRLLRASASVIRRLLRVEKVPSATDQNQEKLPNPMLIRADPGDAPNRI